MGRELRQFEVRPTDDFTFGRSADCTLVIGVGDYGISRVAGRIEHAAGGWWVVNESRKRSFEVVDAAANRSTQLTVVGESGARDRCPIGASPLDIVVAGEHLQQVLRVELVALGNPPSGGGGGKTTMSLRLTTRETAAMIALAEGYLQPAPAYLPEPASVLDVASRIGCKPKQAQNLLDLVRKKMETAGLPGLEQRDNLAVMCRHARALRLVGSDSLAWLDRHLAERDTGATRELETVDADAEGANR